jgi:hypothetical protein
VGATAGIHSLDFAKSREYAAGAKLQVLQMDAAVFTEVHTGYFLFAYRRIFIAQSRRSAQANE